MKAILITLLVTFTTFGQEQARKALRLPLVPSQKASRITSEQKIIALTILAEARGEGEAGMYAVACVIQQRMLRTKRNGISICTQWKQFSCWNSSKSLDHLLKGKKEIVVYALKLAKHMTVRPLKELDRKYVNFADHYCTLKTNPYWAKGKKPVKIIGNHKFFKLN
jgi:hypothetical protein